jgi:tetratricopeptide (TPR) repeat protein
MGTLTKPKVYRLLADAYYQKGDYANAKKYSDEFFAKKNPEDVILPDYEIKADVLSKTGGTPEDIMNAYMAGFALDTTVEAKVGFLKKGAVYFKTNKIRDKEGDLVQKIIDLKPKPTINDYFDLTLARYFSGDYARSRAAASVMIEKYADQPYGYEWKFNSSMAVDTVKKDSIAVPDALELYGFAQKDTAKFKKQYLSAVKFLGAYYINQAKDKEKSLEYFTKWLEADSSNAETIQGYIDQIKKMPATKPSAATPSGNPMPKKPVTTKPAAAKTTKKSTTVVKK